jgi:hypothetical protein
MSTDKVVQTDQVHCSEEMLHCQASCYKRVTYKSGLSPLYKAAPLIVYAVNFRIVNRYTFPHLMWRLKYLHDRESATHGSQWSVQFCWTTHQTRGSQTVAPPHPVVALLGLWEGASLYEGHLYFERNMGARWNMYFNRHFAWLKYFTYRSVPVLAPNYKAAHFVREYFIY